MLALKLAVSRTLVRGSSGNGQHLASNLRFLQLAAIGGRDNEPQTSPLRALLVDAAGTLISPSEPVAKVYCTF